MRFRRWSLLTVVILLLLAVGLLWWNHPQRVDMAVYAPADSLVYLEANNLLDVASSIANTDSWKQLSASLPQGRFAGRGRWWERIVAWTGVGPTASVILARAQVALVMMEFGTREEGDTLKIKPEAALLLETHTSERRIKPLLQTVVGQFAEHVYREPLLHKEMVDGAEFFEWTTAAGDRQIVATINGSLMIVGNSEQAVKTCLAVQRHQKPSLRDDGEMHLMRRTLAADQMLAFGYVSSNNAAHLLALGAPVIMGKAPGNLELERLIAVGAARVLGAIGWTSRPAAGGIEDRYLFVLQRGVISRIRPLFTIPNTDARILRFVPRNTYSLTFYKYQDPAAVWEGVESAVASQLDTVSAIVFTSLAKSALLPYGIDDPKAFLRAVNSDLLTVRVDSTSDRSLLIAGIRNKSELSTAAMKIVGADSKRESVGPIEILESSERPQAFCFAGDYFLLGSPDDIRSAVERWREDTGAEEANLKLVAHFAPLSSAANVITYTSDVERARKFVSAIDQAGWMHASPANTSAVDQMLTRLPYSATQTSLTDAGVERTTRSVFGQFSTLLSLLFPD